MQSGGHRPELLALPNWRLLLLDWTHLGTLLLFAQRVRCMQMAGGLLGLALGRETFWGPRDNFKGDILEAKT